MMMDTVYEVTIEMPDAVKEWFQTINGLASVEEVHVHKGLVSVRYTVQDPTADDGGVWETAMAMRDLLDELRPQFMCQIEVGKPILVQQA